MGKDCDKMAKKPEGRIVMENGRDVPYIVHESEVARLERINKRFFALILTLIILLFTSNGIWIWYESQFEDISMTQEATTDGGGNAIVNGAAGDIYYGESETDDQSPSS